MRDFSAPDGILYGMTRYINCYLVSTFKMLSSVGIESRGFIYVRNLGMAFCEKATWYISDPRVLGSFQIKALEKCTTSRFVGGR